MLPHHFYPFSDLIVLCIHIHHTIRMVNAHATKQDTLCYGRFREHYLDKMGHEMCCEDEEKEALFLRASASQQVGSHVPLSGNHYMSI